MRRSTSIAATAVTVLGATLAVTGPAEAAPPPLRFHGAQYDSPGSDTRSATSLAYLRNASGRAVDNCSWGYVSGRHWVGC